MTRHGFPAAPADMAVAVTRVWAGYRDQPSVLCDVTLNVPRGGCLAIIGPSGSGKTTLLRVIAGLIAPLRGTVRRGHQAAPGPNGGNGAPSRGVGYIPQSLGLVRNRTALENVLLGSLGRMGVLRSLTGLFPATERAEAEAALARVGLAGRGGDRVETLSGGERRRVAIARALLQRPRLLLADEFLAEVDHVTAQGIVALLTDLRRTSGLTIVTVDHDVESACCLADRVLVLVGGRVMREVEPDELTVDRLGELFRPAALG